MDTGGQSNDTDSDEVRLVVEHALSTDGLNCKLRSYMSSVPWHDCSLFTELENLKKPLDISFLEMVAH